MLCNDTRHNIILISKFYINECLKDNYFLYFSLFLVHIFLSTYCFHKSSQYIIKTLDHHDINIKSEMNGRNLTLYFAELFFVLVKWEMPLI